MNISPMWLVYEDNNGDKHYQPWSEIVDMGALIDPDTGDDMRLIGWSDGREN